MPLAPLLRVSHPATWVPSSMRNCPPYRLRRRPADAIQADLTANCTTSSNSGSNNISSNSRMRSNTLLTNAAAGRYEVAGGSVEDR